MKSNLESTEGAAVPFDIDLQSSLAWHRGAIFGRKAAEEKIARLVEQARLREIDYQNLLLKDVDTGGATCGDADATHRILYEYNRAERARARADDAEARSDTFDTEYRRSLLTRALAAESRAAAALTLCDASDWVRRATRAEAQVYAVRNLCDSYDRNSGGWPIPSGPPLTTSAVLGAIDDDNLTGD